MMMSFRGQASWAKMTSAGGKLTTLPCHPTKKVNKAEELTYLSINIAETHINIPSVIAIMPVTVKVAKLALAP